MKRKCSVGQQMHNNMVAKVNADAAERRPDRMKCKCCVGQQMRNSMVAKAIVRGVAEAALMVDAA